MLKKAESPRKPKPVPKKASVEDWIQGEAGATTSQGQAAAPGEERLSRLTLDIPEWLHRGLKADGARRGVKMADELRRMLLDRYGESLCALSGAADEAAPPPLKRRRGR